MTWFGGDLTFQPFDRWQRTAVLRYKPAERAAITFAAQAARHQRDMNTSSGLVPRSKCSGRYIAFDALGGPSNPGVLPVMNRRGPVGSQMRQPAVRHHAVEDERRSVAKQVGSIHQNYSRAALFCPANSTRAILDGSRGHIPRIPAEARRAK